MSRELKIDGELYSVANQVKDYIDKLERENKTIVKKLGGQNEPRVKQLLADIIEHRNKLPKNWKWKKCYELEYTHIGIRKHWALENLDEQRAVASYNLLLQDLTLRRDEIDKDETMLFIEKSLEYIDCLLGIVSKQSV